jgi:hypothetical protein
MEDAVGTMRALWMGLMFLPVLATGCGADCDDAGRFDGAWNVRSWVQGNNWQVSGFNTGSNDETTAQQAAVDQASLLTQLFVNGDTTWELARKGDGDTYTLAIDDQAFDARLVEQTDTCNALDLTFQGGWTGADDSVHTFRFIGSVTYLGDALTGTWKYSDNFTWDDPEASGSVVVPTGVMTASRSGSDTGN